MRVLIADDHGVVRAAIRSLLETEPSLAVVAEAHDGEDALAKVSQFAPDVALVDVTMPKLDGIEVIRRIASSVPGTRTLALTASEDCRHARDSLAAGAAGFLPKSAAALELIAAIYQVAAGNRYVHPRVLNAVVNVIAKHCPATSSGELSARETEVVRLVALGFSNKEIATQLEVSVKTVETYKARATQKLNLRTRVEIVRYAVQQGWLTGRGQEELRP